MRDKMSEGEFKKRILPHLKDSAETRIFGEYVAMWLDEARKDLLETKYEHKDWLCIEKKKFLKWFGGEEKK
jgi:hypothetical protein